MKKRVAFVCQTGKFCTMNKELTLHTHIILHSLSWCNKCERLFRDATQLSSHVKEPNCIKNENIYHCGTQDCSYESLSAISFLNHLLSFHKNNLFIFCHQCKKKFTLPLSLILHMQDDCSFRNTNRGTDNRQIKNRIPSLRIETTAAEATVSNAGQCPLESKPLLIPNATKRSTLIAFRNSQTFSELKTTSFVTKPSPTKSQIFEGPASKLVSCPCCKFFTASQSLLRGHYVESHKSQESNFCLVCNSQFENIDRFIKHFDFHEKNSTVKPDISKISDHSTETEITIVEEIKIAQKKTDLSPKCVIQEEASIITTVPYACAITNCKFVTFDFKEFAGHNNLFHDVSKMFCFYCKSTFTSLEQLETHYNPPQHLHGTNNFQCFYCVYSSKTQEGIRFHHFNNHNDKVFKMCIQPNVKFINNTENTKTSSTTEYSLKKVVAQKDEEFLPSSILLQRNKSCYPQERCLDKDICCRVVFCRVECTNFDIYLNHLKKEHFAISILCPYCSVICEDGIDYGNHVLCHGPNLYACTTEGCRWYSSQKSDVENHMETYHKLKSGVKIVRENLNRNLNPFKIESIAFPKSKTKMQFYICPFCYFQNTSYKLMKNHIYAEFMYTRFQCSLCKEKLCSRSETRAHFFTSHVQHNAKCEINSNSEIEFLTKIFLIPDIQNRFVAYLQCNIVENDVLFFAPKYRCEQCDLCFNNIANWQYHWVTCIFDMYKPYACNYCSQRFGDEKNVKDHTNKEHAGFGVSYTYTENIFLKQKMLKKLQLGKLKLFKGLLGPYLKSKNLYDGDWMSIQFESKYYRCGYCNFNDAFKCNIFKHILCCLKDKVKSSVGVPQNYDNETKEEVDKDSDKTKFEEAYGSQSVACSSWYIKEEKLKEQHDAGKDAYTFYYFPNPRSDFSEADSDLFDCAYCNINQKNIFYLRRHCKKLHSGVPFKVRGKPAKKSTPVKCNYSDLEFMSGNLLENQGLSHPPKIPKMKRQWRRENDKCKNGESSTKVLKKNPDEYQCEYCKELFVSYIAIIMHHKAKHPNLSLNFSKDRNSKGTDLQLISCDLCSYLAEQKLLDNHIFIKHSNCYACTYCGKAFNLIGKILKHLEIEHKDFPIKLIKAKDFGLLLNSSTPDAASAPLCSKEDFGFSHYGVRLPPIDLNNTTVNISSGVSSNVAKLPIVYLSKMFPLFPVVRLKDIAATSSRAHSM